MRAEPTVSELRLGLQGNRDLEHRRRHSLPVSMNSNFVTSVERLDTKLPIAASLAE